MSDIADEVEETVYQLIELGLVEAHSVDENGDFIYRLTESSKEAGEESEK